MAPNLDSDRDPKCGAHVSRRSRVLRRIDQSSSDCNQIRRQIGIGTTGATRSRSPTFMHF